MQLETVPSFMLLLLAFLVVAVAAWVLGRRSIPVRRVRLPRDYLTALNHLVNERFELATEVIERLAASRTEQADIQLALGSLFRRRGEVARASEIHERLRESSVTAIREQATFELGLDYLAAGLLDRAELYFERSTSTAAYRELALDRLAWVYEQQRDFASALRVWHEMPVAMREARAATAGHYLCELAQQSLLQGEVERTRTLLAEARTYDPDSARAFLLDARVAKRLGTIDASRVAWRRAFLANPSLREAFLDEALQDADAETRLAFLATLPELRHLDSAAGITANRFRCGGCGLESVAWQWRCPGCRCWDTLVRSGSSQLSPRLMR
ncbi:MAG: hypothetical protein IPG25_07090 [Proteobacteria bacterium]|nr:hypothetical protein [Pseudomonadota bacterium]